MSGFFLRFFLNHKKLYLNAEKTKAGMAFTVPAFVFCKKSVWLLFDILILQNSETGKNK